ncbi:unnamed protein product, partial [Pylaiella littoralis]
PINRPLSALHSFYAPWSCTRSRRLKADPRECGILLDLRFFCMIQTVDPYIRVWKLRWMDACGLGSLRHTHPILKAETRPILTLGTSNLGKPQANPIMKAEAHRMLNARA